MVLKKEIVTRPHLCSTEIESRDEASQTTEPITSVVPRGRSIPAKWFIGGSYSGDQWSMRTQDHRGGGGQLEQLQ